MRWEGALVLLAHAFGKRYELPIPLVYFVLGAALVVFLSFLVVLPRRMAGGPVESGEERGAPLQRGWAAPGIGVAGLGGLIAVGIGGSQTVAENILPTVFWLVVWIAVPLGCGLLGDWTRPLNPFAALARLGDRPAARRLLFGSARPVSWPARLGWWPATLAFFATACGELVFNQTATLPRVTAWGLLGWAALSLVAGLFFGAPAWLARGELFSVLFATWGRLGWFRFGAAGRRGLAGGLEDGFEAVPSRMAFVMLLLVSVSFDGLLATPLWSRVRLDWMRAATAPATAVEWETVAAFALLGLLTWCVLGAFAQAVARLGGHDVRPAAALHGLLPSLLPIAFGYLLAHNLQYLLINGQLLVPLLGNPSGLDGGQWLPAPFDDSFEPDTHLLPSSAFWYGSVAVIVVVHMAAVVIAHGHLVRRGRDERAAKASEWPWIAAMVAYTMVSLVLMAQPLVKEGPAPSKQSAATGVGGRSSQVTAGPGAVAR
ncbi:hypothetical protein [Streptacidiphilus pinicola]|uniref:hypothetical protein n=1 Tax=Streptacidiphilus pinicola TaxID=2219663 RepID=UPI001057C5A4|nr:hypothetical protein [Streptacidiphilus pinicola]